VSGASLVWGLHAVRAVLARRPGQVLRLLLAQGRDDACIGELRQLAAEQGCTVASVPAAELERLAPGQAHQGALAEVRPTAALNEDDLLELVAAAPAPALVLVLDGVTDPHKGGACLRTADAAGALAVVAPRDRAAGLTPVVRKVAAGAAESLPFAQVTNLARTLRELKEAGLWIVGAEAGAPRTLFEADLAGPLALVLGAEGSGMRRLTRECCDFCVSLPMRGAVESLNVSVAAGVLLFEGVRQRGAAAASGG